MNTATAPATQIKSSNSREQGRILLVSDVATTHVYVPSLEQAGFSVVGVAGGVAAAVALRRTRPHVVIADTTPRDISACELARVLAQSPNNAPLVLVGDDEATIARRNAAMTAGATDYFQVPHQLALLVAHTSQLITTSLLIDHLRAEADRDYLTGLANRRRFRTALGQEVERWRRYKVPCALLIVDVDYMKRINDTHGHSAGDIVIRHVASALTEHSRDNDTAARLGGEEFALLLAGAGEADALAAAERLRLAVSSEELETVGTVTISLGVASCPAHAMSERTLYAATDAALYRAKGEGRNRTAVAPALA